MTEEGFTLARRSDHTKEELQELIVLEAMTLVEENGAANVTARDIAGKVGYTAGTLYTHFENLADIILQVKLRVLLRLRAELLEAIESAEDPGERLLQMGYAYLAFAEAHANWFALLFRQNPQTGQSVPADFQKAVDSLFDLVRVELTALAPKTTATEMDLGVRALWGGVHGICALAHSDRLVTQHWRDDRQILKTLVVHFLASWSQTAAAKA